MDNLYVLNTKVTKQFHLLELISKYDRAYKSAIKLASTSEISRLDNPLLLSARWYKERLVDLKLELVQIDLNERMN